MLLIGGSNGSTDVILYQVNYTTATANPAQDLALKLGDSSAGSEYDVDTKILAGARVNVEGFVNHDDAA